MRVWRRDRPGCANNRAPGLLQAARVPRRDLFSCLNRSSVASRTTGQCARILDMVVLHQPAPDLLLIARRLVAHRGDELARADVLLGVAVAVQAPLHAERSLLPGQRHRVDAPVAGFTTDSLGNVNTVVEVNEIRQIVDARPWDRVAGPVTGPHRLQRRTREPDLRMAVHAGSSGRDVGKTRGLDRRVAIAAVDADPAHVMLM